MERLPPWIGPRATNRTFSFILLKVILSIVLFISLLLQIVMTIYMAVDKKNWIEELQRTLAEHTTNLLNQQVTITYWMIIGIALVTILINLIALFGVLQESFCIVLIMASIMTIVSSISIYAATRGYKYMIFGASLQTALTVLVIIYATLIKKSDSERAAVV